MTPSLITRAAVSLLALVGGCAGGGGGTEPPSNTVSLTSPQMTLVPGETVQLTALVRDPNGVLMLGAPLAYISDSPAIASVSATGLVTGLVAGSVIVRATSGEAGAQLAMRVDQGGYLTPGGGTISGFSDAIRLEVPAGAVSTPVAVRFALASNPLLDPTAVGGSIYAIMPTELAFTAPATLRVRFSMAQAPFGLPTGDLRLRRYATGAWTALPAGSADAGTLSASAEVVGSGLVSVGWVVPDAPCTSSESRQFDFWVGAWNATLGGAPGGTSDITLAPGGCAVFEHFVSGGVGRSISYYVPSVGRWYQTYVDNGGNRLLLEGMFVEGAMDLRTPSWDSNVHGLTRWSAEGANVRQRVAMFSNNGGATYGPPQYDFVYVPR